MGQEHEPSAAERRYEIVPQMRRYDGIRQHTMPYLCQSNPPNEKYEEFETDDLGFRVSYWRGKRVDSTTWFQFERKGILLGGSVALGWGSTSDKTALASSIADALDMPIQSLGIMAGNSLHEFIAAAPFYRDADLVISMTGNNTFYACVASPLTFFDLYGPLFPFNNVLFESMRRYDILSLNYLVSDHIQPGEYFKSREQKQLFRQTMRERSLRRLKNRFFGQWLDPKQDGPRREMEELISRAVEIQFRDIENIFHASQAASQATGKKYLCVLQPCLPSLEDKKLSREEAELRELTKKITRPDVYRMLYEIFKENYPVYLDRVSELCQENDIPFINLNRVEYPGWCFVDSSHLSDHGNQVAARYIAEYLATEKPETSKERNVS